uniref:Phostensin/Taperin PP1-binding domain-containing protein n=1 Tax=Knipowitschia caucasica TaxID=637954 RepID=A0AAV2K0R6_KNICA
MPAWKRGIIQRRKAKYDGPGKACPSETRSPSDGLKVKNKEEMEKTDGKREGRELRRDMSWLKNKAKECVKEKEHPRGQATVIKDERKDSYEDCVFVERGGRVSQLLSRFGEHRKPPSRSKSSENLIPPPQSLGDDIEDDEREHRRHEQLKGVPKSSSPAQSPTPTALFTIKSASGGQVKRGATITITPKKPQAPRPSPTTSPTLTTTTTVTEPTKKKYPTVEEIVVIGGYLNLDKSCLVKNRGTAKKVKVCFSEERLEQLCEYPAESSVWPPSPFPLDLDWDPDLDLRMDSLPKTTRSVGTAMTRGLRAGPCHPLLKKHSV